MLNGLAFVRFYERELTNVSKSAARTRCIPVPTLVRVSNRLTSNITVIESWRILAYCVAQQEVTLVLCDGAICRFVGEREGEDRSIFFMLGRQSPQIFGNYKIPSRASGRFSPSPSPTLAILRHIILLRLLRLPPPPPPPQIKFP